jgi:periplasmic divalent cation tolerance protein
MLIVLTTTPNIGEAESLARKLVEAKLAACVQILPQLRSLYVWEGEVVDESEHLLLIKTTDEKFDELENFIIANHTYTVPEIVAVEADRASAGYLQWLALTVRS